MNKARKEGRQCAPDVEIETRQDTLGRWVGSITIGDEYYETDPYTYKADCTEEVEGYTQQVIKNLINELSKCRQQ